MICQKFEVLKLPVGGDLCWILFCDFCAGEKCLSVLACDLEPMTAQT